MSEETQTQQETTETTTSEVTPAQETSTEQKATDTTQSTQETIPENWEYNGDRKALPKQFQNYAKGFDRAWSKKSQTLAELSQKAREYEEFKTSEDFKAFQQAKANPKSNAGGTETQEELIATQDEMDAIALGDVKTLHAVINRGIKKGLESDINPKLESITKQREADAIAKRESDAAGYIESYSKTNPDFKELLESPVGDLMIDFAKRGMKLEEIHEQAKEIESFFSERHETKRKADLELKKKGSVVGKGISGTPDVVYADNEEHAKRLAVELTLKKDNRQVHIKKK